jgi:hypothetical protein
MIYEQKMVDGECAFVSGLAYLLNVHVYSSKSSGFFDVYPKNGNGRYTMWDSFTNTFFADHARSWHEAAGDLWGGIMRRYSECGSWPKIRELFNTGVHHQFIEIAENDASNWDHPVLKRPVPNTDPQFRWGD